jgi:hypothetical protein
MLAIELLLFMNLYPPAPSLFLQPLTIQAVVHSFLSHQLLLQFPLIYEGEIVAIVDAKETNEQQLGLLMAGGTKKEQVGTNG